MANILVVDDEPKMTSLVCGQLEDAKHTVTTTVSPKDALSLLEKHSFDILITDLSMPDISGIDLLEKAVEKGGCDVIIMTAFGSVESAVEAMKKGAVDYLLKPFSLEELELQVKRLVEKQQLQSLHDHYRQEAKAAVENDFIGSSPATENVKKMLAKVAPSEATVLLTGKSGTGKEVAARTIHHLSPRNNKPFIAVNCAAIAETLLESELFGHEKGAFTGAVGKKRGRFELAEGGTIFLDEIGEMSPGMQTKLLRVLEERKLVRVGGVDQIDIDVRVIAATNRNLKEQIEKGAFREDLYYRLNVFPIHIPGLAERKDDIIELAKHFLSRQKYPHLDLDMSVRSLLLSYDWPGNIRELKNVMERAVILSGNEPLTTEDFSLDVDNAPLVDSASSSKATVDGLESMEKEMIIQALEKTNGNKTEAAKMLKISRRRLYSRMKVHDILW